MNLQYQTKIVSLTKSLIENPETNQSLTPEEFIIYTARVSNPANQLNIETSPKLIKYLIQNKHWSPFEMVNMGVEVVTSRGIAQQILRHRSFSFQEFSQRYATALECLTYEARAQDPKNRQNSISSISEDDQEWFKLAQEKVWKTANHLYKEALSKGIAKECARFLLPLNTKTVMYIQGNIRSWVHYFLVRCDKSTQLEHREIAQSIFEEFKKIYPIIGEEVERLLDQKTVKPSPLSEEEKRETSV